MMNAMEIGHNMKKSEQIKKLTKENEGKLSEVSLHLVNSLAQGMERIEKGNITFIKPRDKKITYMELVEYMESCTAALSSILLHFKGPEFIMPPEDYGHKIHEWQINQINEVLDSRGKEIINLLQVQKEEK